MKNEESRYLSERPDNLCLKCGLCCRVSTTTIPYKKLVEMQQAGDQGAIDFLSIFEPYPSIEAAREVSAKVVDNIIKYLSSDNNYNESEMTLYKCKYISDDNLCTKYEDRLLLCKHFPSSPWAIVPPGCGYEGWLFMKREEIKQKVRKIKEELIELNLLKSKSTSPDTLLKIAAVENKMHKIIEMYKKHGSDCW